MGASSLDLALVGLGFEAGVGTGLVHLRMRAVGAPWAACCEIDEHWRVRCMESTGMAILGCGLDERAWEASARYEKDGDA